ncbi:hypothetical protein Hanom_Chr15g01399811 [Helianthus anomalus]
MLLVWWMGGTILLFLLGVKSLKAPEEHISLVMPISSSISAMQEQEQEQQEEQEQQQQQHKLDKKIINFFGLFCSN